MLKYDPVIDEVVQEAERFLKRIKAYKNDPGYWYCSANAAAVTRSSMDLSKALSRLRQLPKHKWLKSVK